MEKQKKIRVAGIVVAALFILVAAAGAVSHSEAIRSVYEEPRVAVISVNGPIVGGDDSSMGWGGSDSTTSGSLMKQFRKARRDDSVKAVLLRINSPGGSAAATQEAAAELQRLKEAGKPVIVSMGDTAASGAYWLAAYGDKVYANPSTITGSIGVYMSYYDVQGLSDKIGIREEKIKSGPHKDIFSPFRAMTDEERNMTQHMVDAMYEQFVAVVAAQRHMDEGKVRALADGRVFTGTQAKEEGLVDELGNYYDALGYAGVLIHADPDEVPTVTYSDEFSLDQLLAGHLSAMSLAERLYETGSAVQIPVMIMRGETQR